MTTLRFVLAMAWREGRAARRRLAFLTAAIAIGVAALVAINSFTDNLARSVEEQSRALLGADLVVSTRSAPTGQLAALLDSLALGRERAEVTDFDFDAVRGRARAAWNAALGRLRVTTADADLATVFHEQGNMGAALSSGSFLTDGMVIAPCSVRTLAAVASGNGENLVHRAADVVLKERRKLVLVVRETPLSEIHLENMLKLARIGATILPPMPAFYNKPQTIDDIVDHIVARVLDQFGIPAEFAKRWDGQMSRPDAVRELG